MSKTCRASLRSESSLLERRRGKEGGGREGCCVRVSITVRDVGGEKVNGEDLRQKRMIEVLTSLLGQTQYASPHCPHTIPTQPTASLVENISMRPQQQCIT